MNTIRLTLKQRRTRPIGSSATCPSGALVWLSPCRYLIIAALLLSIWANRLPALLSAGDTAPASIKDILKQADLALRNHRWHDAQSCFEQARTLADEDQRRCIDRNLQWCQANTALEDRYRDGSIAAYVRSVDPDLALAQLAETLQFIDREYYQSVEKNALCEKSLLQLQAAAENPFIHRQFHVNQAGLLNLKERLTSLRRQWQADPDDEQADVLNLPQTLRHLSEQAGLGASWPAIELAYAYAASLDDYSHLLSPHQYQAVRDQLNGFYVGIGIELTFPDIFPMVFDVVANSPADTTGIRPGDRLIQVDNVNLRQLPRGQVAKLLTGPRNSTVLLTLDRAKQRIRLSVRRNLVESHTVRYPQLLGRDHQVGYLRIASFDYDTPMEMRRALDRLKSRGATSLIIDLRSNGGGVMLAAVDAVRLFIDRGTIITVNNAGEKTTYCAGGDGFSCYKLPLTLLVDRNTASAAEIFAAALKDHHRAVVIGQKTMGKALIQTIYPLTHGQLALQLTTASYCPPSQKSFQNVGIIPDILIDNPPFYCQKGLSMAAYLSAEDPVLQHGIILMEYEVPSS